MGNDIRPRPRCAGRGFTLIELMLVIAILGILASLAIPAFAMFVRRARTAEVPANLKSLFMSAAAYYRLEITGRGIDASAVSNCTAGPAANAWTPTSSKHTWQPVVGDGFTTIGFTSSDYVLYAYELDSFGLPSTCVMPPNNPAVYVFRATGDVDDDGVTSTFEMAAGTSSQNELYRGVGIWTLNELE